MNSNSIIANRAEHQLNLSLVKKAMPRKSHVEHTSSTRRTNEADPQVGD